MKLFHAPLRWTAPILMLASLGCASLPRFHDAEKAAPAKAAAITTHSTTLAGVIADGTTDVTADFQRALDATAADGGGIVEVPAGRYAIRGNLKIPAHVTLRGVSAFAELPAPMESAPELLQGSVLQAYAGRGSAEGAPFILLDGHSAAVAGLTVIYPEWNRAAVPPVPYPPCIANRKDVENIAVIDCQLINPYEGIHFDGTHRFLIRNVMGYPVYRGLFVDFCVDIGRIENVHFWPFNIIYKPDDPYCQWINTNSIAFEFARTDWIYVLNTFCFGYRVGYLYSDHGRTGTNGNFVGIGADSCQEAVRVDAIQPYGLQITNGNFVGRWSSTDAVTFHIMPTAAGKVSLVNCNFWGPIDRCVVMEGSNAQFTATACQFLNWDVRGSGSAALQLDAGRSIVQGCNFGAGDRAIHVGPGVTYATIFGNQGANGVELINDAPEKSQVGLNEPFTTPAPPPAK